MAAVSPAAGLDVLFQYGALGVGYAALAWFAYGAYRREADRADRLEAIITDRVLPVLTESTHANREAARVLQEIAHDREIERIRREARGS